MHWLRQAGGILSWRVGIALMLCIVPGVLFAQAGRFGEPEALEWRAVFKLVNLTAHAEPGEAGFIREGDDTRESNEQSLRVQLTGQPLFWLDYRFDYLNVKQHLDSQPPVQSTGADLFRYRPVRKFIEEPKTDAGQAPSTQTVQWYHELDHAFLRIGAGPVEAVLGRQPISWGAGRIWQPTDVFARFSPLALDTEYKPGIDAVLLTAYPLEFASLSLAYVATPREERDVDDSLVLRWRGQVGDESEFTALAGTVRDTSLAGGSFETVWLDAGWRLEAVAQQPERSDKTESFAIAGVDVQLPGGLLLLVEAYQNSLGAAREAELPDVLLADPYVEGRLLQLSRSVLALGASREFLGLWHGSYTVFLAGLRDAEGVRHHSALHQLAFTYSLADNAEAVFSLAGASGQGLDSLGRVRSEFGHVPNSLYISLQFVL